MRLNYDLFHAFKVIEAFADTAITGDLSNTLVLDRRDYAPNVRVGCIIQVRLATTADATNFVDFEFYEAAEKSSTTALTSGTIVAAADMYGWSRNGTLDANSLTWPRVNATTQAGDVLWTQYKGTANVIQIRPNETLTADVTAAAIWVLYNGHSQNMAASYSS